MGNNIRLIAGGLILYKSQVLLIKRKDHLFGNKYSIPGGHIEMGETPEKALKREIKEELGIEIKKVNFLNYQTLFIKDRQMLSLNFTAEPKTNKIRLDKKEIETAKWYPLKPSGEFTASVNSLVNKVKELYYGPQKEKNRSKKKTAN